MRLRNMLKICLVFEESEHQYAYKRYAYIKNMYKMTGRYVNEYVCVVKSKYKTTVDMSTSIVRAKV